MYTSHLPPGILAKGFSSMATWVKESKEWQGVLPVDPYFELIWTFHEGDLSSAPLITSPSFEPVFKRSTGRVVQMRMLRIHPHQARAILGHEPSALSSGRSVEVSQLGKKWKEVANATTERELLAALAQRCQQMDDHEMAKSSLRAIRSAQVPRYREIASYHGYSYEQWLRIIKQTTGCSPRFLEAYWRLQTAERIAKKHLDLSMEEIAFRAGYQEASALAKASMKLSGRTFRALTSTFTLPE